MALSDTCLWAAVDDVKPWLKLTSTDDSQDTVLTMLAESVTQDLEAATGRVFVARPVSEVLDGDGSSRLWLTYFPVASLTLTVSDVELVVTDEYLLDSASGLVRRVDGYAFSRGVGNITAAYTAGWARASVPSRITMLASEMLKLRWDEWRADVIAATSINLGAAGMVVKPGWPYHVRDAIDALRREGRP